MIELLDKPYGTEFFRFCERHSIETSLLHTCAAFYVNANERGLSFSFVNRGIKNTFITIVSLFGENIENRGIKQYEGELPNNISFSMGCLEIRDLFGLPKNYRKRFSLKDGTEIDPLDVYEFDKYHLWIWYFQDLIKIKHIQIISIDAFKFMY
ncbi:MAG: hypothetical protein ACFFAS_17000 [Promethearchaeota archaeon]